MLPRRPIHSNTDDSNQFSRGSSEDHLYRSANTTIKMKERYNCRGRSSCNSREMGSTSTTPERREYQRYESKWYGIWRAVGRFFDYVYLFMVTVFLSDTWLLSRLSGVRRSMGQRRSRVLWIALVPLVLLAGWCLSYSSTLFLPGEVIPPHLRDSPVISVKGGRESSNYETYEKRDDLQFIIDQLSSRISSLEDQVFQHSNKILQLEEGLMGQKLSDMYTQEMDVIQSQLEKLKELKNHANYSVH